MTWAVVISANSTLETADGDNDILEIVPADDKPIRLRRLFLSQGSDVGDAAEEGLRITVRRFSVLTASGSGGVAPNVESPDSAITPGLTAEAFNDAVATTAGNNDVLFDGYWNIRAPLELTWPRDEPDSAPTARGGEVLIVRCETTVADQLSASVTANIDEG